MYEQKQISMKQIYSETVVITDLFDEKTFRSFSTWCGATKLDLMLAGQTRKFFKKNDVSKTKIRYRLPLGFKKHTSRYIMLVNKTDTFIPLIFMLFSFFYCRINS